ncbi:hypothetical protein Taro_023054 [Colocasia esculenta]|uniref:Uncharacterized protein n=1 Tax=Colocasia esculenta TaxID=4460 RepID=A0A843V9Q7_COLES|nr:hypothetical protein [Colocasia esculenta]
MWVGVTVPGMASRGRRGVSAREGEQRRDEPRCEDQSEQQAPAPQGSVLPPPPLVDYGVFMQSLVSEPTCGGPRYYVLGPRMVLWRLVGMSS